MEDLESKLQSIEYRLAATRGALALLVGILVKTVNAETVREAIESTASHISQDGDEALEVFHELLVDLATIAARD